MNPNVAIISSAITILALVISIFGASWLNQRNTETLVEQLGHRLDQRIDAVHKQIDLVNQRLDRIERQLEAIFKPVLPPRS